VVKLASMGKTETSDTAARWKGEEGGVGRGDTPAIIGLKAGIGQRAMETWVVLLKRVHVFVF